jgi:hypothetical protein
MVTIDLRHSPAGAIGSLTLYKSLDETSLAIEIALLSQWQAARN